MKFRIAIVAMLVVVGIGAAWLLTRSVDDGVSADACVSSVVPGQATSTVRAVPIAAVVKNSLPTNQTPTVRGTLPFVVRSTIPIDKPIRLEIEALGARTVASLTTDSLLVEADGAVRAKLSADARFTTSEELLPSEKISPELVEMLAAGAETVQVSVVALAEADRALVRSVVENGGGEILKGCLTSKTSFKAKLPAALVAELAGRGDVRWLEAYERPHFMNDIAVDPPAMNIRPVWDTTENPGGLSGAGQIVTTSDTGIDTGDTETMHEDLRNQVVGIRVYTGCSETDTNGHGTHTAGSIAGDGTKSDGKIRGTAWGAKLYAWFCDGGDQGVLTPDVADLLRPDQENYPAYIHSASWGSNTAGRYTDECESFDEYVWEHPDFLPVIAAGNKGSRSRTVGAPAAAKNVLTVGATQNLRTEPKQVIPDSNPPQTLENGDPAVTAEYSSRGPCADNRIKPDVAAPGTGVLSTRSSGVKYSYGIYDDYYAYDTGTSMATPLTAGSVALIREWLLRRDEFSDEETETSMPPTAALMKAIITGGAKDAATPNNDQGWGRVDLAETLYPSNRAVRLVDRIPFAADSNFVYIVETTNAAPLDVQLVWVDYPGDPSANQSYAKLVNDLDLTVEASHGGVDELWYGNGGTAVDTRNNVEAVRLSEAAPAKYVITVNCKKILHDHTEGGAAALYIRGAFDPEARPEPPVNVRIRERDLGFRLFKQAVAAVRAGETIEILAPVNLNDQVAVKCGCTIVATNDDARASAVNVNPGAGITVGKGARVLLQNVVFTNAPTVSVVAGGTLALSGLVVPGDVTTADATGIELAGRITEPVSVRSASSELWSAFGTYTTADAVAAECAPLFAHPADGELAGTAEGGILKWGIASVDDADAVARLTVGGETTNFKSFRLLVKCITGDATIDVRKSCELEADLVISNAVRFVGTGADVAITNGATPTTFTVPAGGSLAIANLRFSGMRGEKFITVTGGSLLLDSGATLSDIKLQAKNTQEETFSAVKLNKGTVRMLSGARIEDCRAGGNDGGGIYVREGLLLLEGGTITRCHAASHGGGVYVYNVNGVSQVRLSGDITVRGNTIATGGTGDHETENDIEIARDGYPLEVVAPLTGSVGIKNRYNTETVAAVFSSTNLSTSEAESSAVALHSNIPPDTDGWVLKASVGDKKFLWEKAAPSVPEGTEGAMVRLVYPDGRRECYMTIGEAFKFINGDCAVEPLTNELVYAENLQVSDYNLTFRTPPETNEVFRLSRTNDWQVIVSRGRSLVLTNICLDVAGEVSSSKPIVSVSGGALTLESGAVVSGLRKDASYDIAARVASGILVDNGGTLTMRSGSCVTDCRNLFVDVARGGRDSGRGGGVTLYNGSTGWFYGGCITNCQAAIGGGLAVWQNSKAYVSGDFTVKSNQSALSDTGDDIVVETDSSLTLAGPLAETARLGRRCEYAADTNLVAGVANWKQGWTAEELAVDAAKFYRSDAKGVRGVAVTNETDAVIVWKAALGEDGSYRPASGEVYFALPEAPNPDPEDVWVQPLPIAFSSIVRADDTVTLVITDAVQWCIYNVFATNTLEGGFAITNSAGEFVVAPATNFQWKSADPAIELTLPATDAQRFWKATAAPGLAP